MDSLPGFLTGSTALDSLPPTLHWLPEYGIGYLPWPTDTTAIYDDAYFAAYAERADTKIGRALTRARVDLVKRYFNGPVLDVGIGCGQFVEACPGACGYDVNPQGVRWLKERDLYRDLYAGLYDALTFWDALEHIPDPVAAVARARQFVFVSVPVFEGPAHCRASKHYKPGEHLWYFEDRGIRAWFDWQGFNCVESSNIETILGREGIQSYVFARR